MIRPCNLTGGVLLAAGLLCAFGATRAFAQESANYASVRGQVLDPTGAALRGATITVRQTSTNATATSETDRDGRFAFTYLRIGVYELKVHQAGFTDAARPLTLTVGAAFDVPVTLALASARESVTVQPDAIMLEAARTQIAGTVPHAELRDLPLAGRSFLELALLIPGVSPTNTASNQLFAETSAVPGQGLSVGSQRNFSNNFLVDGLSANDDAAGLSGVFYGLDAVQEVQVVTSGGQAELGRALGGYIGMVTKSGTNTIHGDFYSYFRNQRLNAANPLSNSKLPVTQAQYGASLGGPLRENRTFYFANFEHQQLNQSGLVTITPANLSAINGRLRAIGYAGPLIAAGIFPNPVHASDALAKLDHQINSRDQFSVRYSAYDVHSRNSRGAGGLNAPSASANLDSTDQTIAISNIFTLSPRTVNETRGQFTNSNLQARPSDPIGPAVSISGVATFGALSSSPTARQNQLFEVVDNLSHRSGMHAFRAGGSLLYNHSTITYPRSIRGSYAFSSLANFLTGTYGNGGFTQTFGNPVVVQSNPNAGFYAQDEWRLGRSLTLNFGLRYDLQFLETISTDKNNLSPRGGFVWSPFQSRRMVIRGSYGLFYDRVPLRALANALLSAGNTTSLSAVNQSNISLSPAQAGAPVFPNILQSAIATGAPGNFTTMNRNMQNAYSEQGSLEIERQVGQHSTISIAYQHVRGLHLIISINQNVPTCVAVGGNNGCRPNPNYANNSQYSSLADSHYDGLHLSFLQRPVRWGSYRVSYAYSKSLDNVGEFFFSSPIDPGNLWLDYGRSDDDQRHRLTFDGRIHSPQGAARGLWQHLGHGFQLSGMLQYYSPLPLNVTSGVTTVQGTAGRPLLNGRFIGRNTATGNDFFSMNVRISRTFQLTEHVKMEWLAEAFNALNHRNNLTRSGNFGAGAYPSNPSSGFRQVTAVNDPRNMQLAVRIGF